MGTLKSQISQGIFERDTERHLEWNNRWATAYWLKTFFFMKVDKILGANQIFTWEPSPQESLGSLMREVKTQVGIDRTCLKTPPPPPSLRSMSRCALVSKQPTGRHACCSLKLPATPSKLRLLFEDFPAFSSSRWHFFIQMRNLKYATTHVSQTCGTLVFGSTSHFTKHLWWITSQPYH